MADFQVWECAICGFIYDEAAGWPDDGIAPGTRWADVPDDWLCPDCGVGKADFAMVPLAAADSAVAPSAPATQSSESAADLSGHWRCDLCNWTYLASQSPAFGELSPEWRCPACGAPKAGFSGKPRARAPLVILGSGLAGYHVAREWRKLEPQAPLVIITADAGDYYSKPLISTGFAKGLAPDQMATATAAQMAEQLNARIITHSPVSQMDTAAKTVTLADQVIDYSQLVLALGSQALTPPLQGSGLEHVMTVNDLTDYRRFHAATQGKRKVLIIGAGLIGSEYANDLLQAGFTLDVVDPLPTPLGGLLPEPVGRAVQATLAAKGVNYHLGTVVERLDATDAGVNALLANGARVTADLALSAIGVKPRTALAASAGLDVQHGIVTNRLLQTSAPDVYALGDCAEVAGHSLLYVLPLMHAARALAPTLAGQPTPVHYPAMPVVIKTTLCPTVVSPVPQALDGHWQISAEGATDVQAIFYDKQEQMRGFALCGRYLREKDRLTRALPAILE